MKPTTREDVIRAARKVIKYRGDSDSITELENRKDEYGEEQQIVDDVNRWYKNLPTTGRSSDEEDWLSDLPYPLK
jgi:DNA phosphorothioation-dependent restriction protein DptG